MISLFPAILIFSACLLFAVFRPKIAIYLPLVVSSAYLVKAQLFGLPSTLLEIILVAVLSGVWLEFLIDHRTDPGSEQPCSDPGSVRVVSRLTIIFCGLFLIAATISAFIAPHPHVAWGYWKAMVVEPIIYALTLFFLVEKDKRAKGVVWALLLGGLVNVALSLFSMGFGVDFGRFRGIYDVPNSLALIVAPLLTMSIIGGLLSWQPVPPTRWSKVAPPRRWYRVLALIFGAVLLATQSLAGLIAVAVTVLGVVIYLKKGWKILITVGLIIVLGFGLQFSSGKLLHLLSRQSSSFIAREQIWYTAFQMIKKHPILGTGLGTFEPSFQDELKIILNSQNLLFSPYSPHPPLEWVVRDPHNVILSFWLNTGFLGMLAMVVLIVNKLTKTVQALREAKNIHQVLLGVALVTLIIFGLFDVPYWKNDLALIWWVLLM